MPLTLTLTLARTDAPGLQSRDDEAPPMTITLTSDQLEDASIHRWFRLFEQVLTLAGFQEQTIVTGACALAFHDARPPDLMHRAAGTCGLVEFLLEGAPAGPSLDPETHD